LADDYTRQQDPNEQYPQTKSPEQEQEHAGPHFEMQSEPDYGYKTYRGNGRLEGKASIIIGEDSGIGRLSSPSPARGRTSCPPTPYKVPFDNWATICARSYHARFVRRQKRLQPFPLCIC
jgi:hypothetical protein